ncbi:Stemmadenine O-acetyltransferase [Linum perenne]
MQISIISTENIIPFSATTVDQPKKLKPFKFSKFDQLAPSSYTPLIFFYPISKHNHNNLAASSSKLKESLSKTLDLFYPLSGREHNDKLYIHDFKSGVPFIDARIHGQTLVDFLQPPKLEFLNELLPIEPICLHPRNGPQVAVQLNTFDCGGIAIGLSFHHRIIDGATFSAFLKTWSAFANPDPTICLVSPDFVSGSSVFPPNESVPTEVQNLMDKVSFQESATRPSSMGRFVFQNDAISMLRSRGTSDKVGTPSRNEALAAFIWKSVMQAAAASESPNEYFRHAVNMRSRMGERLSSNSVGNLIAAPIVCCDKKKDSMKDLVEKIRNGVMGIDENYLNAMSSIQGEKFFEGISGMGESIEQCLSYSSWRGFGVNDFELGLGKPVWTGDHARVTNCVVVKEVGATGSANNSGMEAWIKLDEQVMAALERDPDFLEFASPNPSIVFN